MRKTRSARPGPAIAGDAGQGHPGMHGVPRERAHRHGPGIPGRWSVWGRRTSSPKSLLVRRRSACGRAGLHETNRETTVRHRHRGGRGRARAAGASELPVRPVPRSRAHAPRVRQPTVSGNAYERCASPIAAVIVAAVAAASAVSGSGPGYYRRRPQHRRKTQAATTQIINRGEYLARAGDCAARHIVPNGKHVRGRAADAHTVRRPLRP